MNAKKNKNISSVISQKTYDWLEKKADDIGITVSAYIAIKLYELKKQDDRLI
jgi:hypothetical protein